MCKCSIRKTQLVGLGILLIRATVMLSTVALIVCARSTSICADQLAYNSREECQKALEDLQPGSFLICYCSRCDSAFVEIWQVRRALVTYTGTKDYYMVDIFCQKLYRSVSPVAAGHFSDSVRYEELSLGVNGCEDIYTLEETDFAYLYVKSGEGSYQCLGKKLGLKCEVLVDSIDLPQNITARIESLGLSSEHEL